MDLFEKDDILTFFIIAIFLSPINISIRIKNICKLMRNQVEKHSLYIHVYKNGKHLLNIIKIDEKA